MKAIALANKLARDLDEKSMADLTADARLEILDAINGGLQRMHALAPAISKITTGSILLDAPLAVSMGVATGSTEVTGHTFTADQLYRTVRIEGDDIDNQVIGPASLLHSYAGSTGTVAAILYSDAVAVCEPYDELAGDPRIVETRTTLVNCKCPWQHHKPVERPRFYTMESNARNQNSPAPSVIRFSSLPDRLYRLEAQFTLAPVRIAFADMLSPGADIPLRSELVEVYLLPIARDILASSSLWKNKETKAKAASDALKAEHDYAMLTSTTLATPHSFVRTQPGF